MKLFSRRDRFLPDSASVTIVSGLPRSGTSMMMKMLEEGGIEPLTDCMRTSDIDNPKGYYEYERVKDLPKGDVVWLKNAQGKAVKVVSALIEELPVDLRYDVIFMTRDFYEIIASQKKMMVRRKEGIPDVTDTQLVEMYRRHLENIRTYLRQRPFFRLLEVNFNNVIKDPAREVRRINEHFEKGLNENKMCRVVERALYRNRNTQEQDKGDEKGGL